MGKEIKNSKIAIFEDEEIRREFINDEWYFSVIDVVKVLTDSDNPRNYWNMLKNRELKNGIQLYTICVQLKLISFDGKKRLTDCANTEGLFRIIQSIPSPKAEPFKRWLARVGKERLDEIEQPSKAIERAKSYYLTKGYKPQWVETRTASIETRNSLTDKFKNAGISESIDYAILTNEMYQSWSNFTANEYKEFKGLDKRDSLRDNMTPLELATTIFNEATTSEILEKTNVEGFIETKNAIHIAGKITKGAIDKIEKVTGKKVVTHKNYKELDSPEIRKELAQQSLPKRLKK